ncbi:hypothetical protein KAFR_0B00950 [Kazachstania africana CBS 2517]|uniref:Uncharacterized protein n=1 Tax=Kazachstania africana (strain ATCC 22294 / BCRC 22015 / CBS 2517 / CECT 1963 / NBRC 1671 / NRRL Y-8276) TaxID=1071382 RepID=H2APU3_KAZAF|nr:hypothetical protein KAFR_0B00950 [Kazachstania africana CBS 2517]CCF56393.1 hypothetical protein KAFR_0B00950 [Kazachstania africana CBS 2517]
MMEKHDSSQTLRAFTDRFAGIDENTSFNMHVRSSNIVNKENLNPREEYVGNSKVQAGNSQQHRAVLNDVTAQIANKANAVVTDRIQSKSSNTSPSSPSSVATNKNSSEISGEPSIGETTEPVSQHESLEQNNESAGEYNHYAELEEDDTNAELFEPIVPIYNDAIEAQLLEAKRLYFRSTPDSQDEDTYDVVMVSELVNDIFPYLRQLEEKYRPDANYMHRQKHLKWSYRRVLIDWIVEVHSKFQLLPETLYLTVNIIDRFLSKQSVLLDKFQLVGAAALFIASKYEEINCPSLKDIVYMVHNTYTREQIIEAERFLIDTLDFEIGWPGPMSFLRRISKADDYEYDIRTLAKYLLESTLMDSRLVSASPSWLAAASYLVSIVILQGHSAWSMKHVYYSGYTQEQLLPLGTIILENCRQGQVCHKMIYEKYSHHRQHYSALLVDKWIESAERQVEKRESK